MFLFEAMPWYSVLMWFVVLGGLMLVNELARMSKWVSLFLFLVFPIVLTIAVWPNTAGEGSSVGTWFHWVKVYSGAVRPFVLCRGSIAYLLYDSGLFL
ncbi:hypothetical protein DFP94_11565 [Fontibacillus phaseoli]|uniref:Uncharacterized protein n=1 Tax=Fontibacillus phaseoli TaxID=1416533 RepID=A0A369B1T4_9BACL|nr:DUF5692 family protein [Fontibacillus phaseoli]RCX15381.1 hypothetical protein DFP94_11565 [Fontibacillus phaseoli]